MSSQHRCCAHSVRFPLQCARYRVPRKLPIGRQELETFFLVLNEQELIERVFVFDRCVELTGSVSDRHRQERHTQAREHCNNLIWLEQALSPPSGSAGVVFQPHLPDRHGANVEAYALLGKESALDFRELPRRLNAGSLNSSGRLSPSRSSPRRSRSSANLRKSIPPLPWHRTSSTAGTPCFVMTTCLPF